jgi:hypothetical protein
MAGTAERWQRTLEGDWGRWVVAGIAGGQQGPLEDDRIR